MSSFLPTGGPSDNEVQAPRTENRLLAAVRVQQLPRNKRPALGKLRLLTAPASSLTKPEKVTLAT